MNAKKFFLNGIAILALMALLSLVVGTARNWIVRPQKPDAAVRWNSPPYDAASARDAAIVTQGEVNAARRTSGLRWNTPPYDAASARDAAMVTQGEVGATRRTTTLRWNTPPYDAASARDAAIGNHGEN